MENISANVTGGERWPMAFNNDISNPFEAFRRWGFAMLMYLVQICLQMRDRGTRMHYSVTQWSIADWLSHYSTASSVRVWSPCSRNAFVRSRLCWNCLIGIHVCWKHTNMPHIHADTKLCGGDRANSKLCQWGCWTRPKTCQAWLSISERRRERGMRS